MGVPPNSLKNPRPNRGGVPTSTSEGTKSGPGSPVAAFLTTKAIAETVSLGDHGTTFGGNPLAWAAARAVLGVVVEALVRFTFRG